jgi:hypothetical protein
MEAVTPSAVRSEVQDPGTTVVVAAIRARVMETSSWSQAVGELLCGGL